MTADTLVADGFQQHCAGNLRAAEALYRQALQQDPANINALHMLGVLSLGIGQTTEAVALLTEAASVLERQGKIAAPHAALYNNLGNAQRAAGRHDDAVQSYRRSIALEASNVETHANLGNELMSLGETDKAVTCYRHALRLDPGQATVWSSLGRAYLRLARRDEALEAFRAAIRCNPDSPDLRLQLADTLNLMGQHDEAASLLRELATALPQELAIARDLARLEFARNDLDAALAACQQVLARAADDADMLALAGRIHHQRHDLDRAEQCYRRSLQSAPDNGVVLSYLALLLQEKEQPKETAEICHQLLRLQPDHANGLCILGWAQRRQRQFEEAITSFRHALRLKPDFVQAETQLGQSLRALGRGNEAAACFEHVIALHPDYVDAHIALGNLLQEHDPARAHGIFRQAHALRPLTTLPALQQPAGFAVLLVMAPGVANTPTDYLVGKGNYDAHFLCLLPGIDYDFDLLQRHADVVINLVSDADQGRETLPLARALVERLARPVINHPDKISPTDRAAVAAALAGIPGCRVPRIAHVTRALLLSDPACLDSFGVPFLLRVAGKHGGDDFEMIEDKADIPAFIERSPADDYYAIEYVDFGSADGYFRKYRFIYADGQVLPYHLAIGSGWKVHHYTTEMDQHVWMQEEEETFLRDPWSVFSPANQATLRAIQAAIGLDYFGIDCSLDRNGDVVVFEVNASMLVHDDNAQFPYKNPYVAVIKQAFDAMLEKTARQWTVS
ncbi:MAG TPA: tetratricopeptide repeat protein [Dongiaceae bacterium]|nr:tetratricopeptide repeat protein [Dongiaceae bacterium]